MIHGVPWSAQEVEILKQALKANHTLTGIQQDLKVYNYNRSSEAISRKIRRLANSYDSLQEAKIEVVQPKITSPKKKQSTKWITGALPIKANELTKFVMLNDVHVPHNIPLDSILEFINDFEPDYVLLVGDIVNNDPFDHWARAVPRRFQGMPNPKEYYEECNQIFYRPLKEAVSDNCDIVHWVGNHEYWSNKAIGDMPEGEGYWEVWNNVENIDLWVPNKQIANLGKLHFLHGDIVTGRGHAAKIMNLYRRNVRYGHFHNIEEASHQSPIDMIDRHTARSCGTLEEFNPEFMEGRPHSWLHAFTYGIVQPNGNFWDHTTVLIDGQFMANGKLWG